MPATQGRPHQPRTAVPQGRRNSEHSCQESQSGGLAHGREQRIARAAACAKMELDAPGESESFVLSTAPTPEDLVKLLNSRPFWKSPSASSNSPSG